MIERIENDDMPYYLRFLEDTFPYMDKYHDLQGMKLVLNELSALKKLCRVIQEYNSDKTMDYASVQEAMDGICLTIGDIQQATTHSRKRWLFMKCCLNQSRLSLKRRNRNCLKLIHSQGYI